MKKYYPFVLIIILFTILIFTIENKMLKTINIILLVILVGLFFIKLFTNKRLFIFINAILFALGHLFFRNTLVLFLTFLGGLLFAITFNKTNSTILVSIEHAIYGCWLFTVGMGEMLGFPA